MATKSKTGVTDSGIIKAANIARLAAAAVTAVQTANAIEIAKLQEDLGRGYLDIGQEQYSYYQRLYEPCEIAEITEACSAALCVPATEREESRMRNSVKVQNAMHPKVELRCISRYCTGKRAAIIKDSLIAQMGALATVSNLGERYATEHCDAMDDLRWGRRVNALNRGRDMLADTVSYAGFAHGLFGKLGDQAAAGAEGAMRYFAYTGNRNPTQYPVRTRNVEYSQRMAKVVPNVQVYKIPTPEIEIQDIPVSAPVPAPVIRG